MGSVWLIGMGSAVSSDWADRAPSPTNLLGLLFHSTGIDTPPFGTDHDHALSDMLARSFPFGGAGLGRSGLPSPPADELAAPKPMMQAVQANLESLSLLDSPQLIPMPISALDSDQFELVPLDLATPPSSPASPGFVCHSATQWVPPRAPRLRPKELPSLGDSLISRSPRVEIASK